MDLEAEIRRLNSVWLKLHYEYTKLFNAIKTHHAQHADDLCWMDNNKLYEAAGLPPKDHTVGDKFEMLKNCVRYLDKGCQSGGGWESYAELEKRISRQFATIQTLINESKQWVATVAQNKQALSDSLSQNKQLREFLQDARQLLLNFPGHISEDSWYSWIGAKSRFLATFKEVKDGHSETAAREKDSTPDP